MSQVGPARTTTNDTEQAGTARRRTRAVHGGQSTAPSGARRSNGNVIPLVTIVTDNGGPFRSFWFEAFIATRPELCHVRTRVRAPGQNGSRERGFGTLKYERLFLEEIPDVLDLVAHAEDYRTNCNTIRPHEALSWNRPVEVHTGLADPECPTSPNPESCKLLDAGHDETTLPMRNLAMAS